MDIYFQLKLFYLVLAFLAIHLLAILHNCTNSQTRINVYFPFHLEERTRNAHRINYLKY